MKKLLLTILCAFTIFAGKAMQSNTARLHQAAVARNQAMNPRMKEFADWRSESSKAEWRNQTVDAIGEFNSQRNQEFANLRKGLPHYSSLPNSWTTTGPTDGGCTYEIPCEHCPETNTFWLNCDGNDGFVRTCYYCKSCGGRNSPMTYGQYLATYFSGRDVAEKKVKKEKKAKKDKKRK